MSAATFTPGPWIYKATAGEHDFAVYPESTGRDVALVRDFHEGNARLVAAAPVLYEALRAVEWTCYDADEGRPMFCPSCGAHKDEGHVRPCALADALALVEGSAD